MGGGEPFFAKRGSPPPKPLSLPKNLQILFGGDERDRRLWREKGAGGVAAVEKRKESANAPAAIFGHRNRVKAKKKKLARLIHRYG